MTIKKFTSVIQKGNKRLVVDVWEIKHNQITGTVYKFSFDPFNYYTKVESPEEGPFWLHIKISLIECLKMLNTIFNG